MCLNGCSFYIWLFPIVRFLACIKKRTKKKNLWNFMQWPLRTCATSKHRQEVQIQGIKQEIDSQSFAFEESPEIGRASGSMSWYCWGLGTWCQRGWEMNVRVWDSVSKKTTMSGCQKREEGKKQVFSSLDWSLHHCCIPKEAGRLGKPSKRSNCNICFSVFFLLYSLYQKLT